MHTYICDLILKTQLIVQKLKFELLVPLNSSIFAEQNGGQDAVIACTVAELWTLTRTVLTKHCSEINAFFVVQLLMWAGLYIPVNYPWYEHANSCWKRWRLAVSANEWHNWAIRNLSRYFTVVSGCLALCFVFLGGERLRIKTGNHGSTLYCVRITQQEIFKASIQTHNFRTKARTDFYYVLKESLKITLYDYQQNSKSIKFRLPT